MKNLVINTGSWKKDDTTEFIDYLKTNKINYTQEGKKITVTCGNINKLQDMIEYLYDEGSSNYIKFMKQLTESSIEKTLRILGE